MPDSDARLARGRPTRDTRAEACGDCPAARTGLCARLSAQCRKGLKAIAARDRLRPGAVIGEEGMPGQAITTVTEGVVALTKRSAAGDASLVGFRHPGDVVMPSRQAFTWPVTARALGPCRTCRIRFDEVSRLGAYDAEFEHALHDVAVAQIEAGFRESLLRGQKGVDGTVAAFILDFAERSQAGPGGQAANRPIDIPLTRSEIADYLGLRTETVSRAFGRLKAAKLLALPKPKQIVILDRPALEALAKGGPAR